MKELIWVRVQYASRQQCCKTHRWPLPLPLLVVHIALCIKLIHNSFIRYHRNVKFDVLLAMVLKTCIFWDVTLCCWVNKTFSVTSEKT